MKSEHTDHPNSRTPNDSELKSEKEQRDAILGNLQAAFGLSEAELKVLIDEEHFKHQY